MLQVPKVVVLPRRQLVGDLVGKDDGRADLGQLHAQDGARVGRRVTPRVGRRPDLLLHLGRPEAEEERPLGQVLLKVEQLEGAPSQLGQLLLDGLFLDGNSTEN